MNDEKIAENESQIGQGRETGVEKHEGQAVEKQAEREQDLIRGAEMLEEPPNGSFAQGLQVFVAWVKSLVARDD